MRCLLGSSLLGPSLIGSSLIASLVLVGCAGGGGGGGDGATDDPDASTIRRDAGRDAGGGACPTGQHRCGGGCIDDLANEPENGCRFGCGESCPTPPDGAAACDEAGTCTFACPPPFHREGTECVCTARTCTELGFQCGAPDDGCGTTLDCGSCAGDGVCIDGACACTPDEREPNDSFSAVDGAPLVADIPNEDWAMEYTTFGLHDGTDVDYLRFHVEDSGAFNPEPMITIDLAGIPAGSNYDLSAFYVCDEGGNESACLSGAPDNERGMGCSSASSGTTSEQVIIDVECTPAGSTNDSGTLYIRVRSRTHGGSCAPYRLSIDITS